MPVCGPAMVCVCVCVCDQCMQCVLCLVAFTWSACPFSRVSLWLCVSVCRSSLSGLHTSLTVSKAAHVPRIPCSIISRAICMQDTDCPYYLRREGWF